MKLLNSFTAITLFVIMTSPVTKGQTGVFTFSNIDKQEPNSKTVSIEETVDGNIMLLNLCSDSKYLRHSVQITTATDDGKVLAKTNLEINNLYNLKAIKKKQNNSYVIFGNTSLNKSYNPFQLNVSQNIEEAKETQLPQVYSTLISDIGTQNQNFMILYSKVGKNDLYNISLHKVNAETGSIEWLKTISSENNEEADEIEVTSNGEFYILGKKYNDEVTEFVPVIYKIDENGDQLWKKAIDVPSNFNKQSFHILNGDELIYVCGYTKNQTGFSETRVIKLSNTGEEVKSTSISDFSANGITKITEESFIIFGSKFLVDAKQVVTKGKFVIINKQLSGLVSKTLDETDKPDIYLDTKSKTSSDFLCAYKLSNNKIALGGKVFMPITDNEEEKYNVPLLMIINSDGSYNK